MRLEGRKGFCIPGEGASVPKTEEKRRTPVAPLWGTKGKEREESFLCLWEGKEKRGKTPFWREGPKRELKKGQRPYLWEVEREKRERGRNGGNRTQPLMGSGGGRNLNRERRAGPKRGGSQKKKRGSQGESYPPLEEKGEKRGKKVAERVSRNRVKRTWGNGRRGKKKKPMHFRLVSEGRPKLVHSDEGKGKKKKHAFLLTIKKRQATGPHFPLDKKRKKSLLPQ